MPALLSRVRSTAVVALAAMIGCSPTEKASTLSPAETDTPFQSGQLSGTTAGQVSSPVTTTGSGATVTGLAGRFTSLTFRPSGGSGGDPLGSTPLFFTAVAPADNQTHVWRINFDGTGARQLTFGGVEFSPAADPVSQRVAFWKLTDESPSRSFYSIFSMSPDGSDTTLVFGPQDCIGSKLDWSPAGNVVYDVGCDASVWETSVGKIFVFPDRRFSVVNSSVGQFTLVARPPLFPGFAGGIFKVNYPNRDTTTLILGDTTTDFAEPVVSRTAPFRLAYWKHSAPDTAWRLNVGLLSDPTNTRVIRTVPYAGWPCLAWAPDGNNLLIVDTAIASPTQIVMLDTLGNVGRQITHQDNGGAGCPSVGSPDSGSGNAESVVLIGESGLFGSTASGLIVSQGSGGALQGVVAFRGTPQRSVKLESGTGLNSTGPALTFSLKADRLNALAFTGFPASDSAFQVVDSTATPVATGALITFDAASGAVALILPFSTASVSQAPIVSDAGDSRTFRGTFLAAYDRRGRNLAPNGAAQAVLDLRTGVVRVSR